VRATNTQTDRQTDRLTLLTPLVLASAWSSSLSTSACP